MCAERDKTPRYQFKKQQPLPSVNTHTHTHKKDIFWSTTCRLCQLTYTAVQFYCLLSVRPLCLALSSLSDLLFPSWPLISAFVLLKLLYQSLSILPQTDSSQHSLNLIIIIWVFLTHLKVQRHTSLRVPIDLMVTTTTGEEENIDQCFFNISKMRQLVEVQSNETTVTICVGSPWNSSTILC